MISILMYASKVRTKVAQIIGKPANYSTSQPLQPLPYPGMGSGVNFDFASIQYAAFFDSCSCFVSFLLVSSDPVDVYYV